ncbi:prolyl oligopeptidase family serine peptidase [Rhodanobacter sp. AS-Z3]|uniref:prolyl oligopeptidase family serine peptidase n=1 Tax=Rhodanobacter sp. AS-Z3 TaxID=3031330 RepID=UPI0024789764|nr:prolyl oligopeptidase family serine peptidase [Rhodanobacter sp. AS-Z3]WEN15150.1 prolyl oligopeptidase family serine peptidase [Rhodanobacter sp. AS-Z3]
MKALWLMLALGVTLTGMTDTHASNTAPAKPAPTATGEDPFLWLEDIHGTRAMDWVKQQNATTAMRFVDNDEFTHTRNSILEVLDSDARIPYVSRMGSYLYNFWRDKTHPRGIWRRATLAEYRKAAPAWEVLLDIDALNKAEDKRWVFKDVQCLKPAYERCLVSLSPDGGDAVEVREFDIAHKRFVKNGFELPVAKTQIGWIDEDTVYVGTDFGPGSMTESSYPRIVKQWHRGQPLASAITVYEGKPTDLAVSAQHDRTPGYERDFVSVATDFFHSVLYQRINGSLARVEVPEDADTDAHREWLLVRTRSPWTVGGTTYPAGALLATQFDHFMAGKRDFSVLFKPDAHTSLNSYKWTRHHLILDLMDDVKSRLDVVTPPLMATADGDWKRETMPGATAMSSINVIATDPEHSDEYWLDVTSFLTPSTLERGVLDSAPAEMIKQAPAFFDASQFVVSQHFVQSKDGTRVPYFEIAPKDLKLDGSNRTLLYGYGGFEVSLQPFYSGSVGRAWLERGGVYVIANIRGGGEYGPQWHQAALKANRPRAYEDFAAVAEDLIKRGVTSPKHLGAEGGSNGGLLMGNMLTMYPQLFGAIACEVPLLDMKRYIHLSAGASWMAEYGNPDTDDWNFIKTFSPYQNVKKDGHYPPVLFYTATSDDRVGPVQARKMAAEMQAQGHPNVWFYENLEGGHGAGADNQQSAHMHAMAYDFLWDQLK